MRQLRLTWKQLIVWYREYWHGLFVIVCVLTIKPIRYMKMIYAIFKTRSPFCEDELTLIPVQVITFIMKCGMKLFIRSQTLTVQPLKFGKG